MAPGGLRNLAEMAGIGRDQKKTHRQMKWPASENEERGTRKVPGFLRRRLGTGKPRGIRRPNALTEKKCGLHAVTVAMGIGHFSTRKATTKRF